MRQLDQLSVCGEDTMVIVESSLDTEISDSWFQNLHVIRVKEYKTNKHTFLKKS